MLEDISNVKDFAYLGKNYFKVNFDFYLNLILEGLEKEFNIKNADKL